MDSFHGNKFGSLPHIIYKNTLWGGSDLCLKGKIKQTKKKNKVTLSHWAGGRPTEAVRTFYQQSQGDENHTDLSADPAPICCFLQTAE